MICHWPRPRPRKNTTRGRRSAGSAEGLREGIASPAEGLVATEDVPLTAAY